MIKPFRSRGGLFGWYFGRVCEDEHIFHSIILERDTSMRAPWLNRRNCSHNVSKTSDVALFWWMLLHYIWHVWQIATFYLMGPRTFQPRFFFLALGSSDLSKASGLCSNLLSFRRACVDWSLGPCPVFCFEQNWNGPMGCSPKVPPKLHTKPKFVHRWIAIIGKRCAESN